MSDTLGGSFKQVLNNLADEESIAIYDYCEEEDFKKLWALGSNFYNLHKQHIIIVWDGRGWGGERNEHLLAPHLTPMDWALAFSIETLEKKPKAITSIHIVDLTGKEDDKEWAMQMRHLLLAEMPWVKLYAPLTPKKDGKTARIRQGYSPIITLLEKHNSGSLKLNPSGETLKDAQTSDSRNRLINLARQWSASLTRSDDHHDINNVIGPGFLGRKSRPKEGLRGAFHTRLLWCDIKINQAQISPWSLKKNKLFDKPLSVLTVDDHLMEGWGEFICKLLGNRTFEKLEDCNSKFQKISQGNTDTMNIYGCTGPDPLIQFLNNRAKFTCRDFTQQVMCSENEDEIHPEVILLDLRLPDLNREKVLELLTILCKKLPKDSEELAWPAIDAEEIKSIGEWCDGNANDGQAPDEALLLLPRLLAMALPLTPIILFSATGQARLRGTLRPYQNIFTGFEKPRVLSNPESVESSIVALHEGLDNAVNMMRLRLKLAHAQRAVGMAKSDRPKEEDRICDHHVEIYADETGELATGITSGLAFCVYDDYKTANNLQNKFGKQAKQNNGTIWASNNNPGLSKGDNLRIDGQKCHNEVKALDDFLTQQGLCTTKRNLWSVVATRVPKSNSINKVTLGAFADGPLDNANRFNLEFILYVLIPYFRKNNFDGTIHIHWPTRQIPFDSRGVAEKLAKLFDLGKVEDKFDQRVRRTRYYVKTSSLTPPSGKDPIGTAFSLVRGWLHDWDNGDDIPKKIKKIKTTVLSEPRGSGSRHFHDIADWACTASKKHKNSSGNWVQPLRDELTNKGIFPYWFVSTDGERNNGKPRYEDDTKNARFLMQALRASSSQEQDSDVLRLLLRNTYISDCDGRLLKSEFCSQQRLILWALRDELNHAKGQNLHLLCAKA